MTIACVKNLRYSMQTATQASIMPIKKRKTLPPINVQRSRDVPFRIPGVPLEQLLKQADKDASDAAWDGDWVAAARYTKQADEYRARIAAGELYEVSH